MTTKKIIQKFKKANSVRKLINACNYSAKYQCLFLKDGESLFHECMKAYFRNRVKLDNKEYEDIMDFFCLPHNDR